MAVRVKWQEVNLSIQIPSATRDLAVDSVGDARDATVGAVVQFADSDICVTDAVEPGRNQNQRARELADTAGQRPCIK